jgi:hypothetical protein
MLILHNLLSFQLYECRLGTLVKHLYNGAWLTFGVGFTLNVDGLKTIV